MTMDTLWRIVRRVAFLFVAMIVAANTIAFVILNNNLVHDWFREEINEGFAENLGLQVDMGTISLNVLESTIEIENISVYPLQSREREFVHIQSMTLGFELFSSIQRWYPQSRFLKIADWTADLSIINHIKKDVQSQPSEQPQIEKILLIVKSYIGSQIEIRAGRMVDTRSGALLQQLTVDNLFMRIADQNNSAELSIIAELGQTLICINRDESCFEKATIEDFKTNVVLKPKKNIRFEQSSVVGDFGQWTASGELQLNENNDAKGYAFRIQGDARAAPWFALAGLSGQGNFGGNFRIVSQVSGALLSGQALQSPKLEGRVNWRDLSLSGFDIYTGSADFSYADKLIVYKDAKIITPQAALIEAYGNYSLEGTKPYVNYARLNNFPFNELMRGLRVPTDAIDFKMNTDDLIVRGEMSPEGDKGYSLVAEGPIKTERIVSLAFENGHRRLPDCIVQLKLDTNKKRMTFSGSELTCADAQSGLVMPVELQKGRIDYLRSTTEFQFTAANAPASIVSYFVNEDLSGSMGFRAKIMASPSRPTNFTADIQVNRGRVFDLDFSRLSTRLYLDATKIQCTQTEAWFNEETASPNAVMDDFELNFKKKKIKIAGSFDGEVSDFFAAAGRSGGRVARDLSGRLNIRRINLSGRLDELERAEIDLNASAKNIVHPLINARNLDVRVFCQLGLCTGSRIFAQDLALGSARVGDPLKNNGRLKGLLSSSAIVEVDSYTGKSISLRSAFVAVPFTFHSEADPTSSGILDLNTTIKGGWDNWELSLSSRVDSLRVNDIALGAVALTGSSVGGGPLSVVLTGLNDQIQSRLVFDHSLNTGTQMYLSLRSFDLFRYLPIDSQLGVSPALVLSGDLALNGPGLRNSLSHFARSLKSMKGAGEIYAVRGQLGGESFSLKSPAAINFSQGELSYAPFILEGKNLKLSSTGRYSFLKSEYSGRVSIAAGASVLAGITSQINQADGEIQLDTELRLASGVRKISGQGQVRNVSLAGRYLTPPISGINGRIVVQDTKIEIPTLSGTKGSGQIEVVGTIELGGQEGEGFSPSVALRANIRSGQFRIPQDLFETVEAVVDGQLELVGRGRPFLLNGDLNLVKGRAFRDATCQELINTSGLSSGDRAVSESRDALLNLNLNFEADNSLTLQTTCLRGRVSAGLRLTGDELAPVLAGQIRLENGQLNLLKTRFDVTRADALFDNLVRTEPRLEAQMVARIDKYSVFVGADGPLSRPRLNIWSDPSAGPDGTPLTRAALIRMISTNRGPGDTTQTAVTQAIANGVVGLFDDPLSQAVSKITRGFVDRFELQPILDAGQSTWRARVSRELGDKFNLGLDWEPNNQSLTGEIFINESVNVLGGFDRRSSQIGSYSELKGGFRFQFGGK